jgi:polyisoprenyl-phosphate glycosyltransferase
MTSPEMGKPLISIVVPVFNEETNVVSFHDAVCAAIAPLAERYDFEFVFTDNHSTDRTFEILAEVAARDSRIRVYRFSRNFGYQRSIMSGYNASRGVAAIQLDCDLQDPPSLIATFLKHWEDGADVVYGIRIKRSESWSISFLRVIFYRLIDRLSEDRIPVDAGDFRLISRRVIDLLSSLNDAQPYLRGTIASLGFNQVGVEYARNARVSGESKFPFSKLVSLALDGILNHSVIPLRISTYFGFMISTFTFLGVIAYSTVRLVTHAAWPAGFATLAVLILGSISINAMLLGIIGEYLGRMYRQMKRGPLTIVESSIEGHTSSSEQPMQRQRD